MKGNVAVAVLVALMIGVIVGADLVLFRGHVWARLLANIGIVLVFGALYLRYIRR